MKEYGIFDTKLQIFRQINVKASFRQNVLFSGKNYFDIYVKLAQKTNSVKCIDFTKFLFSNWVVLK